MAENPFFWDITAANNDDADPAVPWPEGMLPGSVNNSARAMMAGIARYIADTNGSIATTGAANAYNITSKSAHATYTNGIMISGRANFTNTGAATLNLNAYGAKNIRVFGTAGEIAVAAGQIQSGGTYNFRYDAAADSAAGAFILLNPTEDITQQVRVGTISMCGQSAPPSGYLFCTGAAVSRTTYANLFAVISTFFGAGDGSTTFNLPDLRGRAPFGQDNMDAAAAGRITNAGSGIVGTTLGVSGGAENVTLGTTQIPSHTHAFSATTGSGGAHTPTGVTGDNNVDHNHTVAPGTPSQTNGTFTGPGGAGWGGAVGVAVTSGQNTVHQHTLICNAVAAHTHPVNGTTDGAGGGLAHNNMPPALIVQFIIKY